MSESSQEKKMRGLTIALVFSGALNIGLITNGVFTQDRSSDVSIRPSNFDRLTPEMRLERAIVQMEKLSFHELVSYLTNKEAVDEGYLKRDLSLACLVAFHHFHIEKALNFAPIQRREVQLNEKSRLELFPGLTDLEYEGIIRFAYEEKWPLTSEGLFKLLKKWPEAKDESLVQAFLVTPEFHSLAMLFQKSDAPQLVGSLIHLISEGSWEILDQFTKQQAQLFDLSIERRRTLLLSYLAIGSKTAAQILLNTDFAFVSKRLEDKGIIGLLSLLSEKSPEAEKLCLEILRSPRSDAVWSTAASNLYIYAGETPPSSMNHQEVIARFDNGNNCSSTQSNQKGACPLSSMNQTEKSKPTQNHSSQTKSGNGSSQNTLNSSSNQNGLQQQSNSTTVPLNYPQNNLTPSNKKNPPNPIHRVAPILPQGPAHSHEAPSNQNAVGMRKHVVKEGESLWKISRIYNVKVDEIAKVNEIDKDRLLPGMILLIPN